MSTRRRTERRDPVRGRSSQLADAKILKLPSAFQREKQIAKEFENCEGNSDSHLHIKHAFNSKKRTPFRFKLPNLTLPMKAKLPSNPHAYHLPDGALPSNLDYYDFFREAGSAKHEAAKHPTAHRSFQKNPSMALRLETEADWDAFHHNFSLKKKARIDAMLKARKDSIIAIEKIKNSKTFIKGLNSLCSILELRVKAKAVEKIRTRERMVLISEIMKRKHPALRPIEPALVSKTTEESNLTWRMLLIEKFLEEPVSRDAIEAEDNRSLFSTNSLLHLEGHIGSSREVLNSSNHKNRDSLLPGQQLIRSKLLKQHSEILRDGQKTDPYSLHPSKLLKSGDYSSYWLVCINRCLAEDSCFDIKQVGFISCFKTNFEPNPKEAEHHLHLQPGFFSRPLLEYQETLLSMMRIYKWNNHSIENDDKFFRNHHQEE